MKSVSSHPRRSIARRIWLICTVAIFILSAGYVGVALWVEHTRSPDPVTVSVDEGSWDPDQEGRDEEKPTADALSSYTVAAEVPRALYIDKLKVAARVLPMGVNNLNAIQAPLNIYDSGWYNGSVKPGAVGAMFIDGHASGPTRQGLFAYLDTLVEGDTLQIEKGNGERLTYTVVHVEIGDVASLDMSKMLKPYGDGVKGLNLMTCTGTWLKDQQTYDKRVMVWTEQIS